MHEGEKVHEAVNNMWRWEIKEYVEKRHKAKEGKTRLRGKKGAQSAKGAS